MTDETLKSILGFAQMYKTLGSNAQHADAAIIGEAIRQALDNDRAEAERAEAERAEREACADGG